MRKLKNQWERSTAVCLSSRNLIKTASLSFGADIGVQLAESDRRIIVVNIDGDMGVIEHNPVHHHIIKRIIEVREYILTLDSLDKAIAYVNGIIDGVISVVVDTIESDTVEATHD